jgi:hypothetical protein
MPYKSMAQERYFNANRSKLAKQGVNVGEWNSASKGMKLPAKVKNKGVKLSSLVRAAKPHTKSGY